LVISCLLRRPPCSPLFPYTTLFRSLGRAALTGWAVSQRLRRRLAGTVGRFAAPSGSSGACQGTGTLAVHRVGPGAAFALAGVDADRKSTRLNSSHVKISYAVFCLKK